MIRSILISHSVVNLGKVLNAQIFCIFLYTLASIILVGLNRPFETRFANNINQLNDFFILITLYHMICFTDFIASTETINLIGYSLNFMLLLVILINITLILFFIARQKLRACKLNRMSKKYEKKL